MPLLPSLLQHYKTYETLTQIPDKNINIDT